jgi:excisionase family DNA binding protein
MVRTAVASDDDDDDEPLIYSLEGAADKLGISRAFDYECVQRGLIPHIRMGHRIVIPRSALRRFRRGEGGKKHERGS